jgi:formylglycine-generating enzyme required for sulfatase activity
VRPVPALLIALSVLAAGTAAVAQEKAIAIDLAPGVHLDLVLVPAGSFDQGSPPAEAGRADDETLHHVTISHPFYIGKVPVTRAQFTAFVESSGYRTEAEKGASGGSGFDGKGLVQRKEFTWRTPGFPNADDHPVTLVTYDDALAFAGWLGKKSGRAVTLPTEAQWEYAARAGTRTRYYAGDGDESAAAIGWFKDNAGNGTRPVGQKKPNAFGLHDMGGDVFEWCLDWYAPYPKGPVTDPEQSAMVVDGDKPRRVLRGGSWLKDRKNLRSAARTREAPGSRNADNGFRVVASVGVAAAAPPAPPSPPPPSVPPPTPPRIDVGGNHESAGPPAACVGAGIIGAIGLFALFASRRRNAAMRRALEAPPSFDHGVTAEPAADGFWLKVPSRLEGARVSYRCQVGNQTQRGTVTAEISDRGQFVYTGARPSFVQIESVVAVGQPASVAPVVFRATGASPPVVHHHHHHHHVVEDSPAPFRGYPSAY